MLGCGATDGLRAALRTDPLRPPRVDERLSVTVGHGGDVRLWGGRENGEELDVALLLRRHRIRPVACLRVLL
jgi:hypothetical protein